MSHTVGTEWGAASAPPEIDRIRCGGLGLAAHDFDIDRRRAVGFHAERRCRLGRQVDNASAYIWSAVVDAYHHGPAIPQIGDADARIERQDPRCRGQTVGAKALAAGGADARVPRGPTHAKLAAVPA